jgi:hypothetical protein
MNPQFKIRCVGRNNSGLSETLDIEISTLNSSRKRVFIILDLSDSCIQVFEHLRKLQPLWRELPSNWLGSFLALGGGEVLPDEGASYSAGDLENIVCELENSPERQKWERAGQSRGSTIHFSLKVVENISRIESQLGEGKAEEKLVFVLTDGELLDADPIILPPHISVIGVQLPTASGRQPRWDKVLPGSKIFLQNSSELFEETRQLVSPENQMCEIKAKFPFSLASDFSEGSLQKQNDTSLNWDFRKGSLVITIPNSVVNDSNAHIECLLKNGESVQLPLLIGKVITEPNQKLSTIAGGDLAAIHDENLVLALQKHFQEKAGLKQKWDIEFVQKILNAIGGQLVSSFGKTGFDAFFAVFVEHASFKSVPQDNKTLVIGKLCKGGPSLVFFNELKQIPLDPGFASLKPFEIKYNLLEARWCTIKNGDTNYLDPKGSVCLNDEFIDVEGRACVAFYSGPLDPIFCE